MSGCLSFCESAAIDGHCLNDPLIISSCEMQIYTLLFFSFFLFSFLRERECAREPVGGGKGQRENLKQAQCTAQLRA